MSRWSGFIGYSKDSEMPSNSGIYVQDITERKYRGDLLSSIRRNSNSGSVNDNIVLSNRISFIGDSFAFDNYLTIKYVTYKGVKWKVDSIEFERPRIIITISEVYNGKE